MKTTAELTKLIGAEADFAAEGGLTFRVRVRDAKVAWGETRVAVEPVAGAGRTWVAAHRVRVCPAGRKDGA
ncbi:MAG: hypothetical protein Q8S13_12465 [Dehalococcoidia bacterium]|nr:hypothetical protein [Dehalococcoidia bacterium]